MMKTGDCVIKHAGVYTTGMNMVVSTWQGQIHCKCQIDPIGCELFFFCT